MTTIPRRTRPVLAVLTLALAALAAGCGSTSGSSSSSSSVPSTTTTSSPGATATSSPSPTAVRGRTSVSISNYAFHPATITVTPGTKVTFANHDQTAHTATSTRPGFDTGSVAPGKSVTVTLRKPGTYTYYCQFHAFMRATLIVR